MVSLVSFIVLLFCVFQSHASECQFTHQLDRCIGLQQNSATTADHCEQACCSESECKFWQFDGPGNDAGLCFIGTSCTVPVNPEQWNYGGKKTPLSVTCEHYLGINECMPPAVAKTESWLTCVPEVECQGICCEGCITLLNTDSTGGFDQIAQVTAGNDAECRAACEASPEPCLSWVNRPSDDSCFLSRTFPTSFAETSDRTYGTNCAPVTGSCTDYLLNNQCNGLSIPNPDTADSHCISDANCQQVCCQAVTCDGYLEDYQCNGLTVPDLGSADSTCTSQATCQDACCEAVTCVGYLEDYQCNGLTVPDLGSADSTCTSQATCQDACCEAVTCNGYLKDDQCNGLTVPDLGSADSTCTSQATCQDACCEAVTCDGYLKDYQCNGLTVPDLSAIARGLMCTSQATCQDACCEAVTCVTYLKTYQCLGYTVPKGDSDSTCDTQSQCQRKCCMNKSHGGQYGHRSGYANPGGSYGSKYGGQNSYGDHYQGNHGTSATYRLDTQAYSIIG